MKTTIFNKENGKYITIVMNENLINKITNGIKEDWLKMLNYVSDRVDCSTVVINYVTETHVKEYLKCDNKVYQTRIYKDNSLLSGLFCESVMASDREVYVENTGQSSTWSSNKGGLFKSNSYFGLPIKLNSYDLFGTISVIGDEPLKITVKDRDLLKMVRDSIEKDLHIINMKERISHLSITDPLSGLYNKHKIDEIVYEYQAELNRAISFVSVAMIKIKNYLEISQEFGDKAAEEMIALLGRIFKNRARIVDRIGILNKDEFIILSKGSKAEGQEVLLRDLKAYTERHLELSTYKIALEYVNKEVNHNEEIQEVIDELYKKIKT